MFEATLKNRISAHLAPVTITFPIPEDQYEQVILALEKSQIGDAKVQDCLVDNVRAPDCPALLRMTNTMPIRRSKSGNCSQRYAAVKCAS